MTTVLDTLTPADLDLPEKFTEYRDVQREIVDFALFGPAGDGEDVRRWMAVGAPGGSGKSVAAHSIAKMSGRRTVILTATKALQDQQVEDKFNCIDIKGKTNYKCGEDESGAWSCDEGEDHDCPDLNTVRCSYRGRVEQARTARVVLPNYAFWLHARGNNRQALESQDEKIGLLICDEFHLAMDQLASFLGTWVSNTDLHRYANAEVREAIKETRGAESGRLGPTWTKALGRVQTGALGAMEDIAKAYRSAGEASRRSKRYRELEKLSGNVGRILLHAESEAEDRDVKEGRKQPNWIWQLTEHGVSFNCIWPARYAERYLWSGVERIILMSATLRPKALTLNGVKLTDSWFREWPSVFPVNDWPVYWIPTGRMGKNSKDPDKDWAASVARLDEIADAWRDYKGVVHTVSYPRAERYQASSRWGRHMILSRPGEQVKAKEEYERRSAPCLLMTPSHGTGFDFDKEDVGYQIIPKLPFPDKSDPVLTARVEDDKTYYDYVTMQTLVQECMRKIRRPRQRCWTFVTDDAVKGFRMYAREHAPRYFKVRDATNGKVVRPPI